MKIPDTLRQSGGVDTKLKAGKLIRWFLVTAAAVLVGGAFCIIIWFFCDEVLNGYLLDWFEQNFMYFQERTGPGGVMTYYREIQWGDLKSFVFVGLVFLVTAWILSVRLISALHSSYQEKRLVRRIGQMIGTYMSPHRQSGTRNVTEVFPGEYAEISVQLAEVRADMQIHEQMLKVEAGRKNDLITYLAHDLKTPLTSVVGYLSLLEEAPDMPPAQKAKYVHIALDKAFRLEKLINEFFEITRYNLQQIVLEKETVDLEFMLVQLADEFYPILQERGNTVRLRFAGRDYSGQEADAGSCAAVEREGSAGSCAAVGQEGSAGSRAAVEREGSAGSCAAVGQGIQVYADPEKLARVFNNILKNAVAYSYPGTEIVIAADIVPNVQKQTGAMAGQEMVTVTFSDHGKTIPRQRLDSIFEKFFRLDEARTTDSGGAGLGLAIAREIVTLHGGAIFAESENEVTVFTVELPAQGI